MKICEVLSPTQKTYLSFKLDKTSRKKLQSLKLAKYKNVLGNHVTLIMNIDPEQAEDYKKIFQNANFVVTGYGDSDNGVDYYTVSVNGNTRREDGKFYHVTASLDPGHRAVESNEYLIRSNGIPEKKLDIPLSGEVTIEKTFNEGLSLSDFGLGKPNVFVDMDGVLANFSENFHYYDNDIDKLANRSPEEIYNYYNSLSMLEDGKKIIDWLESNNIKYTILSAPIKSNRQGSQGTSASIKAKQDWLAEHLGWEIARKAIFNPQKFKYATFGNRKNILIDDMPKYIDPWITNGGIGILHINAKNTIENLKKELSDES